MQAMAETVVVSWWLPESLQIDAFGVLLHRIGRMFLGQVLGCFASTFAKLLFTESAGIISIKKHLRILPTISRYILIDDPLARENADGIPLGICPPKNELRHHHLFQVALRTQGRE
jgi:hypothetical protein